MGRCLQTSAHFLSFFEFKKQVHFFTQKSDDTFNDNLEDKGPKDGRIKESQVNDTVVTAIFKTAQQEPLKQFILYRRTLWLVVLTRVSYIKNDTAN